MTLSVIVPVYNGGENFRSCLASLYKARPSPDEIIVVADGDSDGSWRQAEAFGARVLRLPEPGGPARARNFGARQATGDILLFVDADVAVGEDIFSRVTADFRNEPGLAALIGSYDDEPGASNFLSQYKNLLHHYVHQTGREQASTFWGACGAIRREIFWALDGFNEVYRYPSIEDIELGYRLKRAGHRIKLCKELQVKHLKRWGIFSLLRSDFRDRALPWTRLILRDGRLINDLNLRLSSRVSVVLSYFLALSLAAVWWKLPVLVLAAMLALALFALNAPLYRFFQKKRGLFFMLSAIPWHWLYFLYSGLAFAVAGLIHTFSARESSTCGRQKAVEDPVNKGNADPS